MVTAIAIDSSHNGTVYLGGAQGGVCKSTKGGSSWIPLTDDQPSLAIGSLAVDPKGTLYVGTGEGNNAGDSYYGAGILRSYDGGATWSLLGASTFGRSTINRIVISPTNTNTILVATGFGTTSSSTISQIVPPGVPTGIYLSTDAGNSWTLTTPQGVGSDLVLDPTNPSIVYAAVSGVVYKSTNGGSLWTALSGGLPTSGAGRIALAVSAASPATVFAAIDAGGQGQLYRTLNAGANWSQMAAPANFCDSQCGYNLVIAVDSTDPNTIYLGGFEPWRTTDGGNSWVDLEFYNGGFMHPDQHALAFSPTAHSTVYLGNDGGIWYSTSGNTC